MPSQRIENGFRGLASQQPAEVKDARNAAVPAGGIGFKTGDR